MSEQAVQAWLSAAAQAGVLDPSRVRQAFQAYAREYQDGGFSGNFVDYLSSRGQLDASGAQRLNQACAAASARFQAQAAQPKPSSGRGVVSSMDSGIFQQQLQADPPTNSWTSGARRVPPPPPPPAPSSGAHATGSGTGRWGSGARTSGAVPIPPAPLNTEVSTIVDEHGNPIAGSTPTPPAAPAAAATAAAAQHSLDTTLQYDRVVPTPLPSPAPQGVIPVDSDVDARGRLDPRLETTGEGSGVIPVDSAENARLDLAPPERPFEIDVESAEDHAPAPVATLKVPTGMPEPGEIMGDYRLQNQLGKGATGTVYRAEHMSTGEVVALKVMIVVTGEVGQKRRQRFQREVDALKRLTHENIVGIRNYGRKGSHDFLVMDLVEGRELKELLIAEELKPQEKLQIFEDICKAVTHAHERGVVHRDLKPANVLIGANRAVHVLDFGLAKLINEGDEKLDLTQTHAALGTPYYMAPEQLLDPKGVDWRADVYSLGVMLFELMVGQRPFDGQTAGELVKKVLEDAPPIPSRLSERLQPRFDQICLKALEKTREDRYQNVDDLRLAVAGYRRGTFLRQATSASVQSDRAKRWLEKNKVPFVVGALAASLLWIPVICFVYMFL